MILMAYSHLHLGITPAWDLNDHVQYSLLFIIVQWDVVPWGNYFIVFFDVDSISGCEGLPGLADNVTVCGGHFAWDG